MAVPRAPEGSARPPAAGGPPLDGWKASSHQARSSGAWLAGASARVGSAVRTGSGARGCWGTAAARLAAGVAQDSPGWPGTSHPGPGGLRRGRPAHAGRAAAPPGAGWAARSRWSGCGSSSPAGAVGRPGSRGSPARPGRAGRGRAGTWAGAGPGGRTDPAGRAGWARPGRRAGTPAAQVRPRNRPARPNRPDRTPRRWDRAPVPARRRPRATMGTGRSGPARHRGSGCSRRRRALGSPAAVRASVEPGVRRTWPSLVLGRGHPGPPVGSGTQWRRCLFRR